MISALRAGFGLCCATSWSLRMLFLYPTTLKSVGYYVIPSIQKIAFKCPSIPLSICLSSCLSICMSVCPSAHPFHSLLGAFFNQFSSNLLWELILERSVLGLQMGKFSQISTELQPLIDVRNCFPLSLAFFKQFSSNLV